MAMGMAALCPAPPAPVAQYGARRPTRQTMPSTPNPSAAAEPDPRLSALLFVLRERPGADTPDEALAQVQPFSVTLPGGASVAMAPAWYDLIGDLQLRLVRDTPDSMLTLHAAELDELDELGLGADEAIAAALANLERRHGPPAVTPWHNLRRVGTAEDELDSNWFLARAFWRARLAEHPAGLVVAVPRTDQLLFAPADDAPAVASMRVGIPDLHAQAGDWRLSSALYLFTDDRWTVLQPAAPAPAQAG